MSGLENNQAATLTGQPALEIGEQFTEKIDELAKVPAPSATDSDQVTILKHELTLTDPGVDFPTPAGIELAIRNISDREIATATFQATFYDQEGQVVSSVKHNEIELLPETSRAIRITSSVPHYESHRVKSYAVKLARTTTTDEEPIQLRRHEISTTADGEEELRGIVKNIGPVKMDAAVVWTFYNPKKEDLGTRVVILRDIEPNTIRQFEFAFKPPERDTVRTYNITVGRIEEEQISASSPVPGSHQC